MTTLAERPKTTTAATPVAPSYNTVLDFVASAAGTNGVGIASTRIRAIDALASAGLGEAAYYTLADLSADERVRARLVRAHLLFGLPDRDTTVEAATQLDRLLHVA